MDIKFDNMLELGFMALFDNSVSVYSTSVDDHKIQFYKIIIRRIILWVQLIAVQSQSL